MFQRRRFSNAPLERGTFGALWANIADTHFTDTACAEIADYGLDMQIEIFQTPLPKP